MPLSGFVSSGAAGAKRRLSLRALGAAAAFAVALPLLASCAGGDAQAKAEKAKETSASDFQEIVKKAEEEGKLSLIAYPETWANYKGHFDAFEKKYDIDIEVQSPDISSAEELQAVKNLRGQSSQPDVLDIGYSFTQPAIEQGLIEPYKPTQWKQIPDKLKDPAGYWVGAYYGVLSVAVNTDVVKDPPETFKDLLDPKYKGQIALPGDPRKGASSIATVFAAALANGGSLDNIEPGIEYFAKLAKMGNLVPTNDPAAAMTTGQASIIFDWNYNWIGREAQLKRDGVNVKHYVLNDGVFGNYYAQPLTIDPQHPNAGKVWIDWLTSDEGSEQYALGGAIPARFKELADAGKLSDKALAMLPDPQTIDKIEFPTIQQGEQANRLIATTWAQKVKY